MTDDGWLITFFLQRVKQEEVQKRSVEMKLHFVELQPSLVRALRFYVGLFGLFLGAQHFSVHA